MKKSNFSVNNIELQPSRFALIFYAWLMSMALITVWVSAIPLILNVLVICFLALLFAHEYSLFRRRGLLIRMQISADGLIILQYGRGGATEGRMTLYSFATRFFIYLVLDGKRKIPLLLFRDSMHAEDYRKLTVHMMWLS